MGTEMRSGEKSDDSGNEVASCNSQLEYVIKLSTQFRDDVKLLNEILIESCCDGHLDVVKWMVEHTAADVNYTGVIKIIMTWGEEIDDYHTPLTAACYYKHMDVVRYLLEMSRVDVNLSDSKRGYTPLIRACLNASISVSMFLCEVNNIDVNIANRHGHTALHFAVSSGKDLGRTQLHLACIQGDVTEVMRLVCIDDSVINVQDNGDYTPLHLACRFGHTDIVKTLMMTGADETITDIIWETPAQVADKYGHHSLLKLLDRESLVEMMQAHKLTKLSVSFIVMLTLRLIPLKLTRKKWFHMLVVVHIVLTISKCHCLN